MAKGLELGILYRYQDVFERSKEQIILPAKLYSNLQGFENPEALKRQQKRAVKFTALSLFIIIF